MRIFIEDQVTIGILPTFETVSYHQKIYSQINCCNRIETQVLHKDMDVQIIAVSYTHLTLPTTPYV